MSKAEYSSFKRDNRLDILRAFSILLILLAHVNNVPIFIKNIRTFDVPLMAMLLGSSYQITKKNYGGYTQYIYKRFKRLILPTWIFLIILLCTIYIATKFVHVDFFSAKTILRTFILLDGIGYVWIIRIFFTIALISPALDIINNHASKFYQKILLILFGLLIQYALCSYGPIENVLYREMIGNTFGYMILALLGMIIIAQSLIQNFIIAALGLFLFIITGIGNGFELIYLNKYPPNIYFFGYGIMVSVGLFIILTLLNVNSMKIPMSVKFLSVHSMSIYYWHIPLIIFISTINLGANWLIIYLLVLSISMGITIINNKYIPNLLLPFNWRIYKYIKEKLNTITLSNEN